MLLLCDLAKVDDLTEPAVSGEVETVLFDSQSDTNLIQHCAGDKMESFKMSPCVSP